MGKFFGASDKNVVRDYPDRLHSYYTQSEDFQRVAMDFVERDRRARVSEVDESVESDKIYENGKFDESDSETGSGYNFSRSEAGVNGPVGIIEEFGMSGPVGLAGKIKNQEAGPSNKIIR